MSNILCHKGNASQNKIAIVPLTNHNDYHQENKQQILAGMCAGGNLHTLF
jgi:hypothetical protein